MRSEKQRIHGSLLPETKPDEGIVAPQQRAMQKLAGAPTDRTGRYGHQSKGYIGNASYRNMHRKHIAPQTGKALILSRCLYPGDYREVGDFSRCTSTSLILVILHLVSA
jgi:hypothetical protein